MRYFRSYSYGVQLLLLSMLWYTLFWVTQYFLAPVLFTKLTGLPFTQIQNINPSSPPAVVSGSIVVNAVGNILVFMAPAFLFAYLTHPRPAAYLGLKTPILAIQPILAILMMLGAMPLLLALQNLVSLIDFGPEVRKMQAANENMMNAFLNTSSLGSMVKILVLLAIVPALGEEMFFRGTVMKFIKKRTLGMWLPIVGTALLFALFHLDLYGLPSIFLAGVLLAVIYNLTGSLWCNVAAHAVFNGTQIILLYIFNGNAAEKASMTKNTIPVWMIVAGAVVFSTSLYLLVKNKTPLPRNWTDDFDAKEPKDDEATDLTTS